MPVAASSRRARAALLVCLFIVGCLGPSAPEPDDLGPWMGGAPLLGDLDGDGREELVANSRDRLVALRGADYQPLWTRSDRRIERRDARPLAVIAGGAVVLAQPRALEVLDPLQGTTRARLELSDEVTRLCAAGDKVGVVQLDEARWVLDVATGKRDDAAAPIECPPRDPPSLLCRTARHARCEGDHAGKRARLTDPDTGDSVTVELKDPGTPEVTIVGHDSAGQPTWRVPFDPSGARILGLDLVGGTLLIRQSRVTAVDARTGATLWTGSCGGSSGEAMVGTATRVYYECDGPKTLVALRIVDRATGTTIKDLGQTR
jgi:hypothetical protein